MKWKNQGTTIKEIEKKKFGGLTPGKFLHGKKSNLTLNVSQIHLMTYGQGQGY